MLWGWEGEEERKNNCAFLLWRQSAIRDEGLKCPRGWVGGGRGRLWLPGNTARGAALRVKPLSSPQNSSVLWAAENFCRARAWTYFTQTESCHYSLQHSLPFSTSATWRSLPPQMEKFTLHGMAHSALRDLPLVSPVVLLSPTQALNPNPRPCPLGPLCLVSSSTSNPKKYVWPYPQRAHNLAKKIKILSARLSYENQ